MRQVAGVAAGAAGAAARAAREGAEDVAGDSDGANTSERVTDDEMARNF